MSWFSTKSDSGPTQNFWPVTSYDSGFGALTESDTTWACQANKGFRAETQTWYSVLEDGSFLLVQIIWSYVGVFLVPATTQMTFKVYNPITKTAVWKSISASGFKPDGRSCKSDQFEVKHSGTPKGEESYAITASLDKTTQISVTFTRPADAPGFKLGQKNGGMSIFGTSQEEAKRDGFVVHRFHPLLKSTGSLVLDGKIVDAKGEATFIHAIQGMRPDSIASRWNFAFFTSGGGKEESKLGSVRAIQMELETTDAYGPKGNKSGRTKVNLGAIYSSALPTVPFLVTGQTDLAPSSEASYPSPPSAETISKAEHFSPVKDSATGYSAPTGIEYTWSGDKRFGTGKASGSVKVDALDGGKEGGLIEKVDVLAEIPYVIRKTLSAVTGTKPFVYQYMNPATLNVDLGDEKVAVEGWLFNEASFVSA